MSDDRVRESQALARMSPKLIETGRERIERTYPLGERCVINCVVCGERIDSADDVVIGSPGPAHAHCLHGNDLA
jgi:hypothetical protein